MAIEIDDEDAEMYEENSMVHIPVDLGTFSRTFIGDKYKTPITTVMVGIKGHPVGIKSCIFDNSQCIERGVFFYLSPHFWKIKEEENPPKKKRIKRHIIALPMIDQYNLEGILKFKGFDIIQRQLVFDEATSEINLLGVKSAGINAQSELLENVLCLNNFVKYFKEAKESELFEL